MTTPNPYLWPARNKPVKLVYGSTRLGVAQEQLRHACIAVGSALNKLGYAYPPEQVVASHARLRYTTDRSILTFPPKAPETDQMVIVCDHDWNHRKVLYTSDAATELDHPGTAFYFDLWNGLWLIFTDQAIPAAYGSRYTSAATRYPLPQESTYA